MVIFVMDPSSCIPSRSVSRTRGDFWVTWFKRTDSSLRRSCESGNPVSLQFRPLPFHLCEHLQHFLERPCCSPLAGEVMPVLISGVWGEGEESKASGRTGPLLRCTLV